MTEQAPNLSRDVIEKLKKLLAVAQHKNTGEAEASTAMGLLQGLLAKYNLTLTDIATSDAEQDGKREKARHEKQALYQYQRSLMRVIADSHYCVHWVAMTWSGRAKRYHHVLIGREVNVIAARLMFEYLNQTIERLASDFYPHPTNLSRDAILWKEGCANRLGLRLIERKKAEDAEQASKVAEATRRAQHPAAAKEPGTALVLLTDVRQSEADLNNDMRRGWEPGETLRRRLAAPAEEARAQAEWEALQIKLAEAEEAKLAAMSPKEREKYERDKAREEEAEARRNERFWDRHYRQRDKEEARLAEKLRSSAFRAGDAAGRTVSLDKQVDKSSQAAIAGGAGSTGQVN